jgi:hypothetical protein
MRRRMRGATRIGAIVLASAIGASTQACGGDRNERGLAFDEESTPESEAELKMTEAERREKAMLQEAAKERQEFNEGGERVPD